MKEITLQNSGRTAVLCNCSPECRNRFVVGEMCLTEGSGSLVILKSFQHLNGNDLVAILRTSEELIFTTEDQQQAMPPALLVAIYFDETLENNKFAAYYVFASNKDKSENFSNDQHFDFWLSPAKDPASIKKAKRLDTVPSILGDHVASVTVGKTKVYF